MIKFRLKMPLPCIKRPPAKDRRWEIEVPTPLLTVKQHYHPKNSIQNPFHR